MAFLALSISLLALGPIARSFTVMASSPMRPSDLPPLAACTPLQGWTSDWSPTFVDPDYAISESYQCDGYKVHVSVVQYLKQHQGKEAVGEFNNVIPRAWWNATVRRKQRVEPDLEVNEYLVDRLPLRMTIWNWYSVGIHPTASGFTTKAMEAVNALLLRSTTTTNLTVAVEANPHFDSSAVLRTEVPVIWTWFVDEMSANG